MIHFASRLDEINFTFYGIDTVNGPSFFASAHSDREQIVFHIALNKQEQWEIVGDPPTGALGRRKQLFETIEEHFNRSTGKLESK
jgi:esterase/lipase superfamily enzyme